MDMVKAVRRFDVVLVDLDPTIGSEMQKTRPCLVVSPDEMNRHIRTVIVAPMTTTIRNYPTRLPVRFQRKNGQIALDQIRTVDKRRIVRRLGSVDGETVGRVSAVLLEMFTLETKSTTG